MLYEQEKSILLQNGNVVCSDQGISSSKVEDKDMSSLEESSGLASPMQDDGTSPNMTRWTTEENLSEGASLQWKTQSLADFTQGYS